MSEGKPTARIDIIQAADKVVVRCLPIDYKLGQMANDYREFEKDYDVDAFLMRLSDQGWTVRRWPGGARAWKNGLSPIRTKGEILKIRQQLEREASYNGGVHPLYQNLNALDLAYEL